MAFFCFCHFRVTLSPWNLTIAHHYDGVAQVPFLTIPKNNLEID